LWRKDQQDQHKKLYYAQESQQWERGQQQRHEKEKDSTFSDSEDDVEAEEHLFFDSMEIPGHQSSDDCTDFEFDKVLAIGPRDLDHVAMHVDFTAGWHVDYIAGWHGNNAG
jgi:hypothetical protein